jgi:EAL and modified HD-GYP domain-containing signal transduction protein
MNSVEATAKVIHTTLNNVGVKKLLDGKKGFINIDENVLQSNFIENVPKDFFILEILETYNIDDIVIERIRELKKAGYKFALDDFEYTNASMIRYKELFPFLSYIKIDLKINDLTQIQQSAKYFKNLGINVLVEKVETREEFESIKHFDIDYFQGFFFAEPIIVRNKKFCPAQKASIEILKLLEAKEDMDKIVKAFHNHPELNISLLKFLNSANFSFKNKISSIRQAIMIIGIRNLKNWLLLMMYAIEDINHKTNPILMLAKSRAEAMAELVKYTDHCSGDTVEKAYFIGLLSLLNSIFHMPMKEILEEFQVDKEVFEAIVDGEGFFGKLLCLVVANERNDIIAMEDLLKKVSLNFTQLSNANLSSYVKGCSSL